MVANFQSYFARKTLEDQRSLDIEFLKEARLDAIESDPIYARSQLQFISSQTGETPLEVQARLDLQDEIYDAATSRQPEARLAQVAKSFQIPIDTAKAIAFDLVKKRLNLDPDELEFRNIVNNIREIEAIVDGGLREVKLERLARKHRLPKATMMNAYHKALINQAPFNAYTVEELEQLSESVKDWLVGGWIPQGVVLLLHALGGAGKSLLSYELLECVAKGLPWNGYPVAQGPVLILQSDEPIIVTRERMAIRQLSKNDPVRIVPGWQVEQMARLEAYLKEAHESGHPIKLVMVDSVTAINRNTLISENDTEYARFMLQMGDLGDRYGCTFIVIHHSNSEGESRGTKALYNSASEVWGLHIADEVSGDRVLRVQKTRMGRPPGRYKFQLDEDKFTFAYLGKEGEAGQEEALHAEKRIELWLQEDERRGKRYTSEEIGHLLQLNNNTVRKVLREMWAKGMVTRTKNTRTYLYHVGEVIAEYPSDRQKIGVDHLGDHFANPDQASDTPPSDRVIAKNTEIPLLQNGILGDHSITSPETQCLQDSSNDRLSDREVIDPPTIENAITCDHFTLTVEQVSSDTLSTGELAVATEEAIWYRNGSDKLPSRDLPPSLKTVSSFQILKLPSDLLVELMGVSRVLEFNRDRTRVKLRNQETGRTSIFSTEDVLPYVPELE